MAWLEILLFISVAFLIYIWTRRPKNYPPGPTSFPLIGSVPALALIPGKTNHDKLWNLSKKYGPVTGIFMGPIPTVVVTGYKAVKHILSREDLAYRPFVSPVTTHFFKQRLGVFFTDGPAWKEQRRFTLRHLRDFGFGRRTMEGLIHEEARALIEQVNIVSKQPHFDLLSMLPVHAINILWTIMAGKRHEVDDQDFIKLTQSVIRVFRDGNALDLVTFFKPLREIPFINAGYMRQVAGVRVLQDYIEETIKEHLTTYDENHLRDFIDVYIKEMNITQNDKSSFSSSQLCVVCIDLFSAGTETTSSTVGYCMRYLVQYPHIQKKLRAEILREVGSQRLPNMEDMNKLHYAQAVLAETFRHSGLVPGTPPHRAPTTDTDILGYNVPKDTMIMISLWSVHMDPEIWGDPENFRPERFIGEDGQFQRNEHLLAFGFGPRMCLGEPLAKFSTFLIFTALVQNFEFTPPVGAPPPSSEQLQGFTTAPAPYLVAAKPV